MSFQCPECGGTCFGSHQDPNNHDKWIRSCHGHATYGVGDGMGCGFKWSQDDDHKYGLEVDDDEEENKVTKDTDTLGDKMKALEMVEGDRRAVKGMPLIARLDGRAFHTFTKGLKRPFDQKLTQLMQETTRYLTEETNSLIGYTQSDEITLVWFLPADEERQRGTEKPKKNAGSTYLFDGRYQKMCSILSAMATGHFNRMLPTFLPEKAGWLPLFDARVWQVPTLHEAYQALLWREKDAIKNSISMAAQAHFSPKQLHGVGSEAKKQMLREIGDPWEEYASCYRKGSYFRRVEETRSLTVEELAKIPPNHRQQGLLVTRQPVKQVILPDLATISERELF